MKKIVLFLTLAFMLASGTALAGPYSGPTSDPTNPWDPGIAGDDPIFAGWATGWLDYIPAPALDPEKDGEYTPGGGVALTFRTPEKALGPVGNGIVSLGDLYQEQIDAGVAPGTITLTFDHPIYNGAGADFAAFENGFLSGGGIFAELGYVEVSTDGTNFARFDSVSLTPGPVGGYGVIDATGVYNLVGKHANNYGDSWGTPFDLAALLDNPLVMAGLVDLSEINYVRIIDIPGSGDFLDSVGNPIYDAWVTWGSGGVDFDALGVINQTAGAVPLPAAIWLLGSGLLSLFGIRRRNAG